MAASISFTRVPCASPTVRQGKSFSIIPCGRPPRPFHVGNDSRSPVAANALDAAVAASAVAAIVLPLSGVAGWKASLYSQLEVITARMIGQYVPKDANVVMLGGSTRELYYYPRVRQVTAVGEDTPPSLFSQAGLQAGVPTLARAQPCSDLGFIPDASMDAVVCLRAVTRSSTAEQQAQLVKEACRVLKTGGAFIFIEPLSDDASPLRGLISNVGKATPVAASTLEDLLDQPALEVMQVDVALQGSDPHAVGLARRTAIAYTALSKVKQPSERGTGLESAVKKSKKQGGGSLAGAGGPKGFKKK